MPEERPSAAPVVDQAAWDAAREGVSREMQAARLIASRGIVGIPRRPYLMGDGDHAPVVKSVADFAGLVYDMLDLIDVGEDGGGPLDTATHRVQAAMEQLEL